MIENLLNELKQVPEFKSIPEEQLIWLTQKGMIKTFPDGEKAFTKGDTVEGFSIVLRGQLSLFIIQGGNKRDLGAYEPGEILGLLPFSRMKGTTGEGIAIGELILFFLHKDHFPELLKSCYNIVEILVHNMTDRVRDFTKFQQQNDKMMALGKLSAGLAHELNNPSAAIIRSSQELKKHLSYEPESFKRVIKIRTTEDAVDAVNLLVNTKIKSYGTHHLSMMKKTALEDELNAWLEDNSVPDGYTIAEVFSDFGMSIDDLEIFRKFLREEDRAPVINWVCQVLNTEKLVREIEEASKRINALVTSVKGYTHMDQAPEKQRMDIHEGIRNTLTMLNHKMKKNMISLVENFGDNIPQANIYGSEMNQVWTNVIDNAIDAMEGRPNSTLEIKTVRDREFINVSIIDNGPGIPKEIIDKIFDPFFTTKAIGKGTGLGLEVVQQIIHQHHNGKVDVFSEPGRTEFKICFPIG